MKTYKVRVRLDLWIEYTVEANNKTDAMNEAAAAAESGPDLHGDEAAVVEVVSYQVGKCVQVEDAES